MQTAGIPLADVAGSQTSVYCGSFTNDYKNVLNSDLGYYPKYAAVGIGNTILSNRISYFYDLHGPSMTIDTACSSSLVCFDMGNKSIRNEHCDLSLVVGSALHFDPSMFVMMTDIGFLSTDGRCRAFDASGKGYVRGECICAAVLKRKSRAERDGNRIRSIVRGTDTNHDGTKDGITMPNSAAQETLIRACYKKAGLETHDTQYFEAHGTGTQAGDPRETRAIGACFAPHRDIASLRRICEDQHGAFGGRFWLGGHHQNDVGSRSWQDPAQYALQLSQPQHRLSEAQYHGPYQASGLEGAQWHSSRQHQFVRIR